MSTQHKQPVCLESLLAAWAQLQQEVLEYRAFYADGKIVACTRVQLCALDAYVFLISCFDDALTEACNVKVMLSFAQLISKFLHARVCNPYIHV